LPEIHRPGLRERKKHRTHWALIDAALDLFLAKGYEATTIDEIVAAVDVSQRTFFRYFAGKEDVGLSALAEYDEIFLAELDRRPAAEPPIAALRAALDASLGAIEASDEEHQIRFRKVRTLFDNTPVLMAGQIRRAAEAEHAAAAIIAGRAGCDPGDLRPSLLVATFLTVARVGYEGCAKDNVIEPNEVAARVRAVIARAVEVLPGGWSES
jgi:AcrR family transcriptional regulator